MSQALQGEVRGQPPLQEVQDEMTTEEGALKIRCRTYLKNLGAYRFAPVQQGWGMQSLDDICCIKGKFVGIEYKAKGKIPTPRQMFCIRAIKDAGGIAFWVDSYEGFLIAMGAYGLAPYASKPPGPKYLER
jgi:hypothetical protein